MEKIKVLIWMNFPSHHQSFFFDALNDDNEIDFIVVYYSENFSNRKKLGWNKIIKLKNYERSISDGPKNWSLQIVPDWRNRIHIVPGFADPFLKFLHEEIKINNIKWIHWSERCGKSFFRKLRFNYDIIYLLFPFFFKLRGYKDYGKIINMNALGALAISDLAKKDFIKWGIEESKIKNSNYALQPLKFSKSSNQLSLKVNNKKVFMYVGSLTPHKGIKYLIKAFSLVNTERDWMLVLVGSDETNGEYKDQVRSLGISDDVIFTGAIPSDNINEYLLLSDVFVLPTLFDGWGAVLNEAASLSKPLISTSECGAAFHLIKEEINGFIVKPKSFESLAQAMLYYKNNPERIEEHGNMSFEILKNFTPHETANRFVKNIKELVQF